MKKISKYCRYILPVCAVLLCYPAKAQYETTVELTGGAPNAQIKATLEKNAGLLLTELNNAQAANRSLSLKALGIDADAEKRLMGLWASCPFRCDKRTFRELCLKTYFGGYQIRNISVIMEPRQGTNFTGDRTQQIVLDFDGKGNLSNVCIALSTTQYDGVLGGGEVTERSKRMLILDFVEQFRTAYNRKDITYLERIFSEDALIITGKTFRTTDGIKLTTYDVMPVEKYLENLRKVFKKNEWLNVLFDAIEISKHEQDEIYCVNLIQTWNSSTYRDKGFLFLLWDFRDPDNPTVHVRAWQPEDTPKNEIKGCHSFERL
jgi:hypothetical protein